MILVCPNCETKYNFPDDKYKEGRKVKCTICGHIFVLPPQQAPRPEAVAPASPGKDTGPEQEDFFGADADDSGLDGLFEEEASETAPDSAEEAASFDTVDEEPVAEPAASKKKRVKEEFSLDIDSGKGIDLDALVEKEKGASPARRSKLTVVMGLVTLFVLVGFGYYFFMPTLQKDAAKDQKAEETEQVITTEQIKDFSLENVKQYYVDNEKVGKLFVVQGKVVNNFSTPKELIKIEANLFDVNGASVVKKTMLIGNTVSLFQLQMLSKDELESAINNKVGILTANTNVPSGGEVPFVVVFYDPPDTVQEFGIKVVSAKDPPKE